MSRIVLITRVYDDFRNRKFLLGALARRWMDAVHEVIVGVESYRGLTARYFLPTLAEFREVFRTGFVETECAWGRHELADRCPTFVFTAVD
jgi:hypothetical protein